MIELEKKYYFTDCVIFTRTETFLNNQSDFAVANLGEQLQTDTYYDTAEGVLRTAKASLRIREKSGRYTLTVKSPPNKSGDGTQPLEREEAELELESSSLDEQIGFILKHLNFFDGKASFSPCLTIKNKRSTFLLKGINAVLEMVFDQVTYENPVKKTAREYQIEIELKSGGTGKEELLQFADSLERNVSGLIPTQDSKYQRGMQLVSL
ncbi:CYTH domain-containing protein [Hydrogenoanaerobacterium sp.]|uniref:CYTH domain-containing protein n=1 Tax=Hydrogenoanaerobacterium sp. TaxID=2953763 RepID=UPI00289D3CC3|nr:CYTH domain-containing protein [Hydrogenoanaerobacterium sp.]